MFFPLLDEVVGDMKVRFGPHQQKIATLTRILPCFVKESTWQDILPAAQKYGVFLDPLSIVEGEYDIWKQQWLSRGASTVANTAIGALGDCQGDVFPNVHTLLNILTALPVTTAEPERLFSKLNSTLTAIRSTMSEERLESLLLLQVHQWENTNERETHRLIRSIEVKTTLFKALSSYKIDKMTLLEYRNFQNLKFGIDSILKWCKVGVS